MKEMIFAFLLVLPSVLLVEDTPDDETVSPLSWCWIKNDCKGE